MKKIISLTTISINSDTRTFKEAASLARMNYSSVVFEYYQSEIDKTALPFSLVSFKKNKNHSHKKTKHEKLSLRQKLAHYLQMNDRKIPYILLFPLYSVGLIIFIFNYLWRFNISIFYKIPQGDLYIIHGFYYFPVIYLKCLMHRTKYVYDAHDFYFDLHTREETSLFEKKFSAKFYKWIEKRCIQNSSAFFTVSQGIGKLFEEYSNRAPDVLCNTQDLKALKKPKRTIREILNLKAHEILIVVIGQAKTGQAINESLEAMRKMPDNVYLAFVGNNYEQYIDLIYNKQLQQKVFITGAVDSDQVVRFVETADISLILYFNKSLNYQYALPNGFFQSINAGLAVLFPNLLEIATIAKQFELGIMINPKDPKSIEKAIYEIINDTKRMERLKQNSRNASESLNWEKEEDKLRDIIQKVDSCNT